MHGCYKDIFFQSLFKQAHEFLKDVNRARSVFRRFRNYSISCDDGTNGRSTKNVRKEREAKEVEPLHKMLRSITIRQKNEATHKH